jgi:hypothetical protein
MKTRFILTLACIAGAITLGSPAFAAKGNKNKGKGAEPAAQFDKNNNGRIDPDEAADLQAAFEKDKNGPLKKYDTNHNGNIEKSEVSSIHVPIHAKKAK